MTAREMMMLPPIRHFRLHTLRLPLTVPFMIGILAILTTLAPVAVRAQGSEGSNEDNTGTGTGTGTDGGVNIGGTQSDDTVGDLSPTTGNNSTGTNTGTGTGTGTGTSATPTEPLTQEQAEALLPPPLPVVALTPRNVFGSPDPLIRAALRAYIASLDGPRDRYGNSITENYVSATMPDTVPTDVVSFIAGFVEGRMLVGISKQAAAALANLQAHQRAAATQRLIFDSLPEADKRRVLGVEDDDDDDPLGGDPASASGPGGPGNSGGGSDDSSGNGDGSGNENTPNLGGDGSDGDGSNGDGSDGGDSGADDGSGGDGSGGDGSGGDGSGGNDGSAGDDDAGATGLAGTIEDTFNVQISSEPKPFTDFELQVLQGVLTDLPQVYYAGEVIFERIDVATADGGQQFPIAYGVTFSARDVNTNEQTQGKIQISDIYADQTEEDYRSTAHPYPFVEYGPDTQELKRLTLRHTFIHELTHNYLHHITPEFVVRHDHPKYVSFAEKFGWSPDSSDQGRNEYEFDCSRVAEAPTQYAYDRIAEDMCESVALFWSDPQRLDKTATAPSNTGSESRAAFVEGELDLAGMRPANPNITVDPECQRQGIAPCDCP